MAVTYSVSPEHVETLVEKLTKLAKRAAKLDCPPLTWTVGEPRKTRDPDTNEVSVWQDVEVDGTTPRYAGWHFVASVELYGEELLVTTAPGEETPADFDRQHRDQNCDHCRQNRTRNQTYLLRHDDGRWVRVGSTCLKDFLGHSLPSGLPRLLAAYGELDDFVAGLGGGAWGADLLAFLTVTALFCRRYGFTSRGKAYDSNVSATADEVLSWFEASAKGRAVEQPTERDEQTAKAAIDWALALQPGDTDDYLQNVLVVAKAGFVTLRTAGIAASILRAAELAAERAARDARAADLARTSQHFGEIGERSTWQATLLGCYTSEGYYGTTWIFKWVTADGNAATWFSSRSIDTEIGQTVWLTGTIKKHDEYKGTAETHLTRCKVSTDEPPKPRRRRKKAPAKPKRNPNVLDGESVTIEPEGDSVWVWGHGTYERSSVLAGQCRRRRIECFATVEAAKAEYPKATVCEGASSAWMNRLDSDSFERSLQPGWFDPADAGEAW